MTINKFHETIDDKNFNIKTDGLCYCPNQVPIIYIGVNDKDKIINHKSNKCKVCGGLIVLDKVKGGLKLNQNEITKDRVKAKPKSRRL